MEKQTPIRVAIFGHYMPIYRKGVLEKISNAESIELTVFCTANFPVGLRLIDPNEVSFKINNIRTFSFKIPYAKQRIYYQPSMIFSLLFRSYDVYILPNVMSYLDVWVCLFLSKIMSCKICLWGHGKGSVNGKLAHSVRKFFMNLSDALVFYTENAKNHWMQAGIPDKKMFVAYNALDTEESARIRSKLSELNLKKFLISNGFEGKKIIVFCGRLQSRKQPEVFIDALAKVILSHTEAHAVIIGDGHMMETIKKRINELGVNKNVTIVGALFDEEIIAYYLSVASIAVIPAHAGLFIQHAFDYGVPIVVGDNFSSHPPEIELVKDSFSGLFFEHGNSDHLAEKILVLLNDEHMRLEMSQNAKKLIELKYNLNSMADGLLKSIRYSFNTAIISR